MKKYQVYGISAALVDTEIEVSDAFLERANIEKGMMILVDEQRQRELLELLEDNLVASRRASGGSAANTIIANSCFGGKSFLSCRVANDDNGRFYLDDLKRAGVDTNYGNNRELLTHANGTGVTGKCLVLITPDAERSMQTYLGASEQLSVAELDRQALVDSEYLYIEGYQVTSPTGLAASLEALQIARENSVKTAISFSDPGIVAHFRQELGAMLDGGVDLVFCNEAEALAWSGRDTLEASLDSLGSVAAAFAITRGGKGALIHDGQTCWTVDAQKVLLVDTNGAGDMFAGAFLYAITQGHDFATAGELANLAAGTVVSSFGPRLPGEVHRQILHRMFGNPA